MVAGVTAGLAESNGSLPPGLIHVTCRLTAKNWDQLWNPTLGNRVWATFTFFTCCRGSVVLCCDVFCTSDFIDGIMFAHSIQE